MGSWDIGENETWNELRLSLRLASGSWVSPKGAPVLKPGVLWRLRCKRRGRATMLQAGAWLSPRRACLSVANTQSCAVSYSPKPFSIAAEGRKALRKTLSRFSTEEKLGSQLCFCRKKQRQHLIYGGFSGRRRIVGSLAMWLLDFHVQEAVTDGVTISAV